MVTGGSKLGVSKVLVVKVMGLIMTGVLNLGG